MSSHDQSHKQLFSFPQMVEDLLRGYVHEPWVSQIDFTTLERIPDSFVTDDLRDREDDIIWRVRWGERWLYLYLIIEFQSTVDPFMAVRLLTYVGLLYQDLKRTKRMEPNDPLPPVLPIVLYNGIDRWTAATELAEMREPDLPPTLAQFQPQLRYLLLDEGRIAEHPDPNQRNLVAAMFRMEFSPAVEDGIEFVANLFQWLNKPEQAELRRAFTIWLNRVGIRRHLPDIELDRVYELQEIYQMLAERSIDWSLQWKQQGRQEGRREEGTHILSRQLKRRFGPDLPAWVETRLANADADQLEAWAEAFVDARTLDEVFGA